MSDINCIVIKNININEYEKKVKKKKRFFRKIHQKKNWKREKNILMMKYHYSLIEINKKKKTNKKIK